MKAQLRQIARMMAEWPVIGRFVRIGVAVIRLPEFCATYLDINHRQHVFETQQLPTLLQTLTDLNHRQHVFETQQLPTLLQTLTDLNHRQLTSDNCQDNLVKSVPVALRKITRDLIELREQIENVSGSTNQVKEQIENVSNSVGYLLGRVEFVRRELLFEMRYGAFTQSGEGGQLKSKIDILSPEKLAAARKERLRLNLGCGHVPLEGYINIDRRALPGIDIVAEVDELPLDQDEVDEIFSAHLLEHFPQEQLRRELLPYWSGLLKIGGEFRAVVPDADGMIKAYSNSTYPFQRLREVTFGGQDYNGDFHFNMLTPNSLSELLLEAGFVEIKVIADNRENGGCKEFEISARRGRIS